jgi:aspartate aminotransferase
VRAFKGGPEIERYLWNARRLLRALAAWMCERLEGAGIVTLRPDGAFYLFLDFEKYRKGLAERNVRSSHYLCEALLQETGVAILPGGGFGRPGNELTARLAYVDFDGARVMAALGQMPKDAVPDNAFFEQHCQNLVRATQRLCEWARGLAG